MKYTELRTLVKEKIKNREMFSARSIYDEVEDSFSYVRIDKNLLTMYNRGEMPGYRMEQFNIGGERWLKTYYPVVSMVESIKILWRGLFGG